jgi:hypothetical protein
MPFTKVVEQCKIYNFGIQRFAYFSSKIFRKTLLNKATPYCLAPERAGTWARTTWRSAMSASRPYVAVRAPRQTGDRWSVRGAEALLCVVLWAPDSRHALRLHASVGPAAFGHWPVPPPAGRHWSSPLAPPLPHTATHYATTLVIPSPRHTAYRRPADLLLTRPRVRRRPPLAFLGELPCPFEPRTF